ncbi:hypothetical protein WR25_17502 [Diploscapter pachys]|uniref:Uncharacterized protein n=1 Tax=Diploscapter pachys TaxID=2018661 RepID=A0A2A2L6G9_9BILA|nr:hypothetical protein WR25_17502 [Diploscapter pachys]
MQIHIRIDPLHAHAHCTCARTLPSLPAHPDKWLSGLVFSRSCLQHPTVPFFYFRIIILHLLHMLCLRLHRSFLFQPVLRPRRSLTRFLRHHPFFLRFFRLHFSRLHFRQSQFASRFPRILHRKLETGCNTRIERGKGCFLSESAEMAYRSWNRTENKGSQRRKGRNQNRKEAELDSEALQSRRETKKEKAGIRRQGKELQNKLDKDIYHMKMAGQKQDKGMKDKAKGRKGRRFWGMEGNL